MSQLNVLVIDDSKVMRSMIIRTLGMSGLPLGEVHEAEDGRAAIKVLEDHWVDLALVDINMPVMNGEEFIEHVRSDPELRDLAIVVVSTESSEMRIERIRGHGAEFVHKPFTPEHLRGTVQTLIGPYDAYSESIPTTSGSDFDF